MLAASSIDAIGAGAGGGSNARSQPARSCTRWVRWACSPTAPAVTPVRRRLCRPPLRRDATRGASPLGREDGERDARGPGPARAERERGERGAWGEGGGGRVTPDARASHALAPDERGALPRRCALRDAGERHGETEVAQRRRQRTAAAKVEPERGGPIGCEKQRARRHRVLRGKARRVRGRREQPVSRTPLVPCSGTGGGWREAAPRAGGRAGTQPRRRAPGGHTASNSRKAGECRTLQQPRSREVQGGGSGG